jgi:hypothetical protein
MRDLLNIPSSKSFVAADLCRGEFRREIDRGA